MGDGRTEMVLKMDRYEHSIHVDTFQSSFILVNRINWLTLHRTHLAADPELEEDLEMVSLGGYRRPVLFIFSPVLRLLRLKVKNLKKLVGQSLQDRVE
jgi:hypothetical protein